MSSLWFWEENWFTCTVTHTLLVTWLTNAITCKLYLFTIYLNHASSFIWFWASFYSSLLESTGLQHERPHGSQLIFSLPMVACEMCTVKSGIYYVAGFSSPYLAPFCTRMRTHFSVVFWFTKSYYRTVLCILCFSTLFTEICNPQFLSHSLINLPFPLKKVGGKSKTRVMLDYSLCLSFYAWSW